MCGEIVEYLIQSDDDAARMQGLVKAPRIGPAPQIPTKIRNTNKPIHYGLFKFELIAISLIQIIDSGYQFHLGKEKSGTIRKRYGRVSTKSLHIYLKKAKVLRGMPPV